MQVIITFFIYTFICLIITYYFNLFITQNVYTRSELGNILPQVGNILLKIYSKYSLVYLFLFYIVSGFISIIILSLFENWLINSALLPLILFFSIPKIALYFEQTRVTISEDYKDIIESLITKYHTYMLFGFFSGYSSKLINNWVNLGFIPFYWLFINLVIITGISILILRKDIFD